MEPEAETINLTPFGLLYELAPGVGTPTSEEYAMAIDVMTKEAPEEEHTDQVPEETAEETAEESEQVPVENIKDEVPEANIDAQDAIDSETEEIVNLSVETAVL